MGKLRLPYYRLSDNRLSGNRLSDNRLADNRLSQVRFFTRRFADFANCGADGHRRAFLGDDRREVPRERRRNFRSDFVRLDFEQRFVLFNDLSDFF